MTTLERCRVCGREEYMPFVCPYCRSSYCGDHRLPENHQCPNIWMARAPVKVERRDWLLKKGWSLQPGENFGRVGRVMGGMEVKHLLISWLVLGFSFSMGWIFRFPALFPLMLGVSLTTVGIGFILHELAHKFAAQRYGYWAEFRMSPFGLAMAIIFATISGGNFVFAAPGATYIASRTYSHDDFMAKRENGIISLIGPLTNVGLAFLFFVLSFLGGVFSLFGETGYRVNLWLAAFNLIPFMGMDGQKVLSWNIFIWLLVTVPLWIMIFFPFELG